MVSHVVDNIESVLLLGPGPISMSSETGCEEYGQFISSCIYEDITFTLDENKLWICASSLITEVPGCPAEGKPPLSLLASA